MNPIHFPFNRRCIAAGFPCDISVCKKKVFTNAFQSHTPFRTRLMISGILLILTIFYPLFVRNSFAEKSTNRYQNELSKAGIYSFFAAFKNNELDYNDFYTLLPKNEAFNLIRNELKEANSTFITNGNSIKRVINNPGTEYKPNVIMITVKA